DVEPRHEPDRQTRVARIPAGERRGLLREDEGARAGGAQAHVPAGVLEPHRRHHRLPCPRTRSHQADHPLDDREDQQAAGRQRDRARALARRRDGARREGVRSHVRRAAATSHDPEVHRGSPGRGDRTRPGRGKRPDRSGRRRGELYFPRGAGSRCAARACRALGHRSHAPENPVSSAGRLRLTLVVALVAPLLPVPPVAAQQRPQPRPIIVKEIAVEGARRVQEAVVLGRVKTTVGSPFNPTLLSEDIRSIFGLGFFDDVQVRVEDFEGGVKVTFVVNERPFVRDVDFAGNKAVKTTELQDKVDLKLGSVYNPVDVQRAVEKLRDFYEDEGYFEVQVTPNVERIIQLYNDHGYVQARVESTDVAVDREKARVTVTFTVVEGPQFKVGEVKLNGITLFPEQEVRRQLKVKPGDVFSRSKLRES